MSFRTLELFAGIAGISHGLRGISTPVAFVEINEDAQKFLKTKFSDASVFNDVTKFTKSDFPEDIDMITAGFPCTGFSIAGSRTGFEHKESGLFADVVRITEEYKPKIVFLENSHMLSHTYNLDVVVKKMDEIGYFCKWVTCRASIVGAHHQRHRWFCLAIRKDYEPKEIIVSVNATKFDWENNEPPCKVDNKSYENSTLVRLAGYSVVPDQIRYAFTGLFTGDFESSWKTTLTPGAINGTEHKKMKGTYDKVINGYYENDVYYSFSRKEVHRAPLNISVKPRDIPEKHNGKTLVDREMIKKYWCTPCASYGTATAGCNVLTDRQSHALPTQVRFSYRGVCGRHLSGIWCAWLMGYDQEYLSYLVQYD
ncbi:DNA methyltransferase [Paramecium bursaria Chlorella virus 1]|uniref:Cytosine-specific methyltransferase n=1 Tax=Paramecium bursaria Chlorella virus 1 TaxID=10506 RepID=O41165_PBCV1|nr:DNA methyltransferase [Paramecium bursaria Chlorella virus 1]AAC96987.1 hypothetical protein [Paramecium bursaria Chlorella virus 1]